MPLIHDALFRNMWLCSACATLVGNGNFSSRCRRAALCSQGPTLCRSMPGAAFSKLLYAKQMHAIRNGIGSTALHIAAANDEEEICKMILACPRRHRHSSEQRCTVDLCEVHIGSRGFQQQWADADGPSWCNCAKAHFCALRLMWSGGVQDFAAEFGPQPLHIYISRVPELHSSRPAA